MIKYKIINTDWVDEHIYNNYCIVHNNFFYYKLRYKDKTIHGISLIYNFNK